jgi:hypothetical protein
VQEPRGAAARELGFDSSQVRATPTTYAALALPAISGSSCGILLAQAKSAQARPVDQAHNPWRVRWRIARGVRASVTHAGRTHRGQLRGRVLAARSYARLPYLGRGSGRQNARADIPPRLARGDETEAKSPTQESLRGARRALHVGLGARGRSKLAPFGSSDEPRVSPKP